VYLAKKIQQVDCAQARVHTNLSLEWNKCWKELLGWMLYSSIPSPITLSPPM